ncbi:MAG: hypothetical protein SGBAC_006691 [Bacillariaceae sp.]
MITRNQYSLLMATILCHQAVCFQVVNPNIASSNTLTDMDAPSSTSLNYAVGGDAQTMDNIDTDTDSVRNSILNLYQREETPVSEAQLLTDQVAREFTASRRYLLAASAVKELSEDFFDVEEQQRVRAMEVMEFARTHDIELLDYSSQVEKTPIDKSMESTDLLQELLVQENKDTQVLEQAMTQVSSKNTELFTFLESIREDQMERKDQVVQMLSDALPTLQQTATDTAASVAAAQVSTDEFSAHMGKDLMSKFENVDQIPSSVSRWAENQFQDIEQFVQDLVSKSGHFTFTGATAATVAAVDAVDTEAIPVGDILQAVEPSQLVDSIQQNLMETEALAQIVDIVTGLY